MNGVLTQKELRTLLKNKEKEKVEEVVEKPAEVPTLPPEPLEEVSQEEHFLFHPDNPKNSSGYLNGTHIITVSGRSLNLPLNGGVIRTGSVLAKNELIKQGFVFMYSRPKGADNG